MITERNGKVTIDIAAKDLERAIANFERLKPVMMMLMKNKNYEDEGERDAAEIGRDFDTAIEAMKQSWVLSQGAAITVVGGWIPVGEKLPEKGQTALCSFDDGFVATATYCEDDGDDGWALWQDSGEVVAWMPLPQAYPV